jgi:lysine 2,3-aminomutase
MKDTKEEKMMSDIIEKVGDSLIQHGQLNNRIYLLKTGNNDLRGLINRLDQMAVEMGYTKIFGKVRAEHYPLFVLHGYRSEACIPGFFKGQADCILASKFFDKDRAVVDKKELKSFTGLFKDGMNNLLDTRIDQTDHEFDLVNLDHEDAFAITEIFKQVFATYPFPVHEVDYILETIREKGVRYFGIKDGNNLVAVSTAEIDMEEKNAEMTDFAVLPKYRGRKFASQLLSMMEADMKKTGIKTLFTIARLKEPGINKTFLNAGYKYTGTLANNTNISGNIESMNIFYKKI